MVYCAGKLIENLKLFYKSNRPHFLLSAKDDTIYVTNALPPSWTLKLTANWGETKKDVKGEVARPSSLSFLICFQAGAHDQWTSALSLKKKFACSAGQ